eukprot:PhM_4_TR4123/c0_g1_i2/m.18325
MSHHDKDDAAAALATSLATFLRATTASSHTQTSGNGGIITDAHPSSSLVSNLVWWVLTSPYAMTTVCLIATYVWWKSRRWWKGRGSSTATLQPSTSVVSSRTLHTSDNDHITPVVAVESIEEISSRLRRMSDDALASNASNMLDAAASEILHLQGREAELLRELDVLRAAVVRLEASAKARESNLTDRLQRDAVVGYTALLETLVATSSETIAAAECEAQRWREEARRLRSADGELRRANEQLMDEVMTLRAQHRLSKVRQQQIG